LADVETVFIMEVNNWRNWFVCLSVLLHCTQGTKIVLETTPNAVVDGLSRTLTLRCSLRDTAPSSGVIGRRDVTQTVDNVDEVSSLILMHNGQDVASISHSHGAHVMDGETNLRVTGSVDGSLGGEGFLELTFDYPTSNNSGEFVCEASTVRGGHGVTFSTSAEVGFSEPSMADLVAYVRQNEMHKDQMQQQIDQLTNITKTSVVFSAVLTKPLVVAAKQTAVFDKVYANLGGGYNNITGEFHCPVSGYYSFSMGAHLNSVDPHVFFIMYHNTENILAMYASIKNGDTEMAYNSVIRKLSAGDVVKVMAFDQSSIYANDRDRYCSFSGHLLFQA